VSELLHLLNYSATGKLALDRAEDVIKGIGDGGQQAGCALVGGETAEMPGMYEGDDHDLAGFCVGVVEKAKIIDGSKVAAGDTLIGLAASGPQSNGYSLVRKIIEVSGADLSADFHGQSLGETLLTPTRIYVKALLALLAKVDVHALAHITGGGLPENLNRSLPDDLDAKISKKNWDIPPVFKFLKKQGNVSEAEMYKVFNMGIGYTLIVRPHFAEAVQKQLQKAGETVYRMGEIVKGSGKVNMS